MMSKAMNRSVLRTSPRRTSARIAAPAPPLSWRTSTDNADVRPGQHRRGRRSARSNIIMVIVRLFFRHGPSRRRRRITTSPRRNEAKRPPTVRHGFRRSQGACQFSMNILVRRRPDLRIKLFNLDDINDDSIRTKHHPDHQRQQHRRPVRQDEKILRSSIYGMPVFNIRSQSVSDRTCEARASAQRCIENPSLFIQPSTVVVLDGAPNVQSHHRRTRRLDSRAPAALRTLESPRFTQAQQLRVVRPRSARTQIVGVVPLALTAQPWSNFGFRAVLVHRASSSPCGLRTGQCGKNHSPLALSRRVSVNIPSNARMLAVHHPPLLEFAAGRLWPAASCKHALHSSPSALDRTGLPLQWRLSTMPPRAADFDFFQPAHQRLRNRCLCDLIARALSDAPGTGGATCKFVITLGKGETAVAHCGNALPYHAPVRQLFGATAQPESPPVEGCRAGLFEIRRCLASGCAQARDAKRAPRPRAVDMGWESLDCWLRR